MSLWRKKRRKKEIIEWMCARAESFLPLQNEMMGIQIGVAVVRGDTPNPDKLRWVIPWASYEIELKKKSHLKVTSSEKKLQKRLETLISE